MTLLVTGLLLWIAAHHLKRLAPALYARIGAPAAGITAAGIALSIILMVLGYRTMPYTEVYTPPAWGVHLNNLAMLFAVGLVGLNHSKGRLRATLRHPMLWGLLVWAAAHLLTNGDLASLILFGGLGLWAAVTMPLLNRADGAWDRPEPGPVARDIRFVVITLFVFAAIAALHGVLGPSPFPS